MTLNEVITNLTKIKEHFGGDLLVVGSSDEEQNTLGDVFQIQVGALTEYDEYTGSKAKVGELVVVVVPAI